MGTAVHVGASLRSLPPKSGQGAYEQFRATGSTATRSPSHGYRAISCSCAPHLQSQKKVLSCRLVKGPQWLAKAKRAARFRVSGVDNLGLEPRVEEEDATQPLRTSLSAGILETLESRESGLPREPSASEEEEEEEEGSARVRADDDDAAATENWRMFAAEEGARPASATAESDGDSFGTDEDASESDVEDEASNRGGVRRRKAEDLLPLPGGGANWTPAEKEKVHFLHTYKYRHVSERGVFVVQAMRAEHMEDTEELLVDSFAELMGGLLTYRPLLALTVKQYVRERCAALPHSVTLVGLYAPSEDNPALDEAAAADGGSRNWLVAGTVELSFSVTGHPYLPTPAPPANAPYLCNMAVSKDYRRRGLGRQMLKAAEDLAMTMGCQDMYLHCRIVDAAPLNMYQAAGYQVAATDSLLSVLTFQRRRYLMRKRLSRAPLVPE